MATYAGMKSSCDGDELVIDRSPVVEASTSSTNLTVASIENNIIATMKALEIFLLFPPVTNTVICLPYICYSKTHRSQNPKNVEN